MSEETPAETEEVTEKTAPKKKVARKRSNPAAENEENPSPAEKSAPEPKEGDQASAEADSAREDGEVPTENPSIRRVSSKKKSAPNKPSDSSGDDEPVEQVATIVEPPAADSQGKKRRRRRRKGGDAEDGGDDGGQSRQASRIKLDPEKVAQKAWKIFLSEVSEEGLALVSDQDAKEIGRRSFRLAEIFLEEASRRQ